MRSRSFRSIGLLLEVTLIWVLPDAAGAPRLWPCPPRSEPERKALALNAWLDQNMRATVGGGRVQIRHDLGGPLRRRLGLLAVRRQHRDQHQRGDPDEVEVEPVGRAQLQRDQDG